MGNLAHVCWGSRIALLSAVLLAASAATTTAAPKPVTHDRDPVFSPGGQAIAFVRWGGDGTGRVMLMHRDGRGLRALTPAQPQPAGTTWSPDGKAIAYAAGGDIWRVDLAGGAPLDLTNDPAHESWQPSWSPDGAWIVYDRFEQCFRCTVLHLVSADGTQSRTLGAGNLIARRPTFSPSGDEIALTFAGDMVIGLDGSVIAEGAGGSYVAWSPDGKSLLYTGAGLTTYDIATQTARRLTDAIKAYPVWSRDGTEIAGTGFRGALTIVSRTGRTIATVKAAATGNDGPTWGADDRVAFVHAGGCGIDVAHGDGTHVHRLTKTC